MFFTDGKHLAFERLMRERPGDRYDSGANGLLPECRSCRFHRPRNKDQPCRYKDCPYCSGQMNATAKGDPQQGGDAGP